MADMAEDPTPLTLPRIPEIAPESPRSTAQRRTRGNPAARDETARGGPSACGASGSAAVGTTTGAGGTATMTHGDTPAAAVLTSAEQIAAFVASPMKPEPHHVQMDHITFLLALVLGGDVQEATVKLLMAVQTPDRAADLWATLAPYFSPFPGHPLAGENMIRDVVIAALVPVYKSKTAGMNAAKVLLDAIVDAVHIESFRQFNAVDLEEEMAVSPSTPSPVRATRSQHQLESHRTLPYPAGLRTFPTRTTSAERGTKRALPAPPLGDGTLLSHPVYATQPSPLRASPRLEPLRSRPM